MGFPLGNMGNIELATLSFRILSTLNTTFNFPLVLEYDEAIL
jgi:hypothetical protein